MVKEDALLIDCPIRVSTIAPVVKLNNPELDNKTLFTEDVPILQLILTTALPFTIIPAYTTFDDAVEENPEI